MSDLEMDRARRQATVDEVLSWTAFARQGRGARRAAGERPGSSPRVLRAPEGADGRGAAQLPARPGPWSWTSSACGSRWSPIPSGPSARSRPRRRCARSAPRCARRRRGSRPGIAALRSCRVGRDGWLRRDGRRFTAEDLRAAVNTAHHGRGLPAVAHHLRPRRPGRGPARGGTRADPRPHAGGHGHLSALGADGLLRRSHAHRGARPRVATRCARSTPSSTRACASAIAASAPARTGRRSTARSRPSSTARGYRTGLQDGRMQGFFHGTGHGLGPADPRAAVDLRARGPSCGPATW